MRLKAAVRNDVDAVVSFDDVLALFEEAGQLCLDKLIFVIVVARLAFGDTFATTLASPLQPESIVIGKVIASLAHLALLVFTSLPIVMLCLPLGGVSLYEVLAAYLAMLLCVFSFGLISLACSSYFSRTSASLVVSYLLILPLAIAAVATWWLFRVERIR